MRPGSQKQSYCDDRYGGLYIFLMEFLVQYIVLKYCTKPWEIHVTYLPTFCRHFLLDGDPGETSVQNLLPSLGSGEFLCQKI
jgi:hypothetical protein